MAELITIQREEHKPRVVCPHCKKEILIDISPFVGNVAQVMMDKCPLCRGDIYVGVLILAHSTMNGMGYCINACVNALNTQNKIIGGQRT
jgi:hypothetical protein